VKKMEPAEEVVWTCEVHGVLEPEDVFTVGDHHFCAECIASILSALVFKAKLVRRKKDVTAQRNKS